MVQKLKKSKGETENGRKKFANRMAEGATPFANFSLFFGAFIYMGSDAISTTPKSFNFDID